MAKKNSIQSILWDLWCTVSVVGIWPRYIEPKIISSTYLNIPLAPELKGLKILQFSDLHLHRDVSDRFLNRISKKILKFKPDLIIFSGDVLCYSQLKEPERIKKFFNSLSAPYGCFAILGNHDYDQCVSINAAGDYDLLEKHTSSISQGLKRLFSSTKLSGKISARVYSIPVKQELIALFQETPFKLLHNESVLIDVKGTKLNIVGLGEYILGRCLPELAFSHYNPDYPGLVLAHNPDSIELLKSYPGEIMLSGHTHGGQINLPGLKNKFILMENPDLDRGLIRKYGKSIYVNRGIGSIVPFRWFAVPELLHITIS